MRFVQSIFRPSMFSSLASILLFSYGNSFKAPIWKRPFSSLELSPYDILIQHSQLTLPHFNNFSPF